MTRGILVCATIGIIALAGVACDDQVEPAEWYLGTEIVNKSDGVIGLSVIVLRHHTVAPDGTVVFFECERPLLDGEYLGIEVRTVSGRASVDVMPPGEPVVVTFRLPREIGCSGQALLPPIEPSHGNGVPVEAAVGSAGP